MDFRPICILAILLKLYMTCLIILCEPYFVFTGFIQYGGRGGYSAPEMIFAVRIILEKCMEWRMPLIMVKLDVAKAFDSLRPKAIIDWIEKVGLPIRLKYALLKELLGPKWISYKGVGVETDEVFMFKGLRQGSVEATLIFALVLNDVLSILDARWKAKGWGVRFGNFMGNDYAFSEFFDAHLGHFTELDIQALEQRIMAFMDDIMLFCCSIAQAQEMINDVSNALNEIGLHLSHGPCKCTSACRCKCMWMIDSHSQLVEGTNLYINGVPLNRVYQMNVLGSIVTANGCEKQAIDHRISCSWGCFQKWSHIFCSNACLSQKMKFWYKTVFRSITWGVQTLRYNEAHFAKLNTTFKLMVRRMLGLKRRPILDEEGGRVGCEQWLDFYKRSMSRAGDEIDKRSMSMKTLVGQEVHRWAGHISRMGLEDKPEHQVKGLVAWRCRFWWQTQQLYNNLGWDTIFHIFPFKPCRWEDQFSPTWFVDFSEFPKISSQSTEDSFIPV